MSKDFLELHFYGISADKIPNGKDEKHILHKINREDKDSFHFYDNYYKAKALYGITHQEQVYTVGDVFYNQEKNELLIVSSYIVDKLFIGFGFFQFNHRVLVHQFMKKETYKDLVEYMDFTKFKQVYDIKYSPITTYVEENHIVYKGNLFMQKNKTDDVIEFLMNEFDLSYEQINFHSQYLEKYNKEFYLYKEIENPPYYWHKYSFTSVSFFDFDKIKTDKLYPELGIRLDSYIIPLGCHESVRLIKQQNEEYLYHYQIPVYYVLNKDYQTTVCFEDEQGLLQTLITSFNEITKEEIDKYILLNCSLIHELIHESDTSFDDYYLRFI